MYDNIAKGQMVHSNSVVEQADIGQQQPNWEEKVELPLILASGVLVLAWLVSYLALLQTNQESRGIEECCNQNKLTKLGRCDSYTIDWLLIKLSDCWDCKFARTLREACPFQNGWIFGKVPNGSWPLPLIFGKSCCGFFPKFMTELPL